MTVSRNVRQACQVLFQKLRVFSVLSEGSSLFKECNCRVVPSRNYKYNSKTIHCVKSRNYVIGDK